MLLMFVYKFLYGVKFSFLFGINLEVEFLAYMVNICLHFRNYHTVLQKDCTILYPQQKYIMFRGSKKGTEGRKEGRKERKKEELLHFIYEVRSFFVFFCDWVSFLLLLERAPSCLELKMKM